MFEFKSKVEWIRGVIGKTTLGDADKLEFALPKEFGGEEGYVRPEEMFLSSLGACFSVLLWRYLNRSRVEFKSYEVDVIGRMERDEEGYFILNKAKVSALIRLVDEADVRKTERAVELSEKYCPVTRVVERGMELKFDVSITV